MGWGEGWWMGGVVGCSRGAGGRGYGGGWRVVACVSLNFLEMSAMKAWVERYCAYVPLQATAWWRRVARCGKVWSGVEMVSCGAVCCVVVWGWSGVVWCGVARHDMVWRGVEWSGVEWRGVVWWGVVWCGAVWCGAVWCSVVRCGVVCVVWCDVVSNPTRPNPSQPIRTHPNPTQPNPT